ATVPLTHAIESINRDELTALLYQYESASAHAKDTTQSEDTKSLLRSASNSIYSKLAQHAAISVTSGQRRIDQSPLPTSQIVTTFGAHNLAWLVYHLQQVIQSHLACYGRAYHLDIQNELRNELSAAYALLSSPSASLLWSHCNLDLVQAVRTQNMSRLID